MKKLSNLFCFIITLALTVFFASCGKSDNCAHEWSLIQSTQEKTVYECTKCKRSKEFNLEFDKAYTYTNTEIIIPETLTIEELVRTIPTDWYSYLTISLREEIGEIDTVDKFKIVLNELIKTGNLHFRVVTDSGILVIYVENPIQSISITDKENTYVLNVIYKEGFEEDEPSGEFDKNENTSTLMSYSDYETLRFIDGKIQYSIYYLCDIEIIFNFEIS